MNYHQDRQAGLSVWPLLLTLVVILACAGSVLYVETRFDEVSQQVFLIRSNLDAGQDRTQQLNSKLSGLTDNSQKLQGQMEKQDQQISRRLQSTFEKHLEEIQKNRDFLQELEHSLTDLTDQLRDVRNGHQELAANWNSTSPTYRRDLDQNTGAIQDLTSNLHKLSREIAGHSSRVGELSADLGRAIREAEVAREGNLRDVANVRNDVKVQMDRFNLDVRDSRSLLHDLTAKVERLRSQTAY
jgi:chromosome segregation ATPase